MRTLVVTYDLNFETRRPDILKEIKGGGNWAKLSESSYAIHTSETPQQVYKRLEPYLDDNDNLLVITLNAPWWGRAPQDVLDWLMPKLQFQNA